MQLKHSDMCIRLEISASSIKLHFMEKGKYCEIKINGISSIEVMNNEKITIPNVCES